MCQALTGSVERIDAWRDTSRFRICRACELRRVKSLSILSSASRAVRPRYEIPNSVEPEGACASSRNDPTSSYLRAPSCLAKRGRRGAEGVSG